MNALAIPQTANVTPLHPRLCVHCEKKPVYAPNAMYCGTSCRNKAYRARKRAQTGDNPATIALQQRVEQLLVIVEQQSQQITALTAIMQKQPTATTFTADEQPPRHVSNVQPQRAAAADDLLKIETSSDTNGGKNLLNQLLEMSQNTTATKKSKRNRSVTGSPKKLAATQPVAAPNFDDLIAEITL